MSSAPLREFCAANGLDYEVLSGARSVPIGPDRLMRSETYAIELGGCQASPGSVALTAIRISHAKRFANSILQLSHALQIAHSLGVQRLYLPHLWYLTPGWHHTSEGLAIHHPPSQSSEPDLRHDSLVLTGSFLRMSALRPLQSRRLRPRRLLRAIRPLLRLETKAEPAHRHDLTIHLRSGDVFRDQPPHPSYGQPPLAFYQRVIVSRPWRRVSLVFEDQLNPVIPALLDWLPRHCEEVVTLNGSLESDLTQLLRARNLVSGRGTFCCAVAALSRRLRHVFSFDEPFPAWGNRRITNHILVDRQGLYAGSVCRGNWSHSPEQRQLMLNYPITAIDPPRLA